MSKPWIPHEYMTEGVKFLVSNSYAGLFFDPGLGKTSIVMAAILVLKNVGMFNRALVVAPRRGALSTWPDERTKWTDFHGLTMDFLTGTEKQRQKVLDTTTADIVVTTPDLVPWFAKVNAAQRLKADVLIVDESGYFRHQSSDRYKAMKSILEHFKRRIILNGTPVPRGYEDLFTQIYILDMGGALGRYLTHYRMRYFYDASAYGNYADYQLLPGAEAKINDAVRPLVLRGDAVDHLQMPALIRNTRAVRLPAAVMQQYRELEKEFYIAIQGYEIMTPNAASLSNKLRQVSNGFAYATDHTPVYLHTEKLDALRDLLLELQGKPALVLYEFTADLTAIREHVTGVNTPALGGMTTDAEAKFYIEEFNRGALPVLLAHPASAGHSINLQNCAQHIIWFGPTWNLEHHDQTNARVWRQGNPHDRVTIHTIVAADTIEEIVATELANKNKTQKEFLVALKRRKPQPVAIDAAPVAP